MPAIRLELRLAGSTRADTATETGHLATVTDESRRGILQLGKLDLQLSLPRNGVQGKDVQDEHRAVDHTHRHLLGRDRILQIADLRGRKLGVEHDERNAV